jgi:hypothetical protein
LVFNQFGNLERSALRPGSVHGGHWDGLLMPIVADSQGTVSRI